MNHIRRRAGAAEDGRLMASRMPIVTFRKSYAPLRGVDIIEIWWGDSFIATIAPGPSSIASFTVVSKYLDLDHLVLDTNEPPALGVTFDLDHDA